MRSTLGSGGLRGRLHAVALSVASLAAIAAVQGLILDVILGAAMAGRGAATVKVAVCTGTGAGDSALGVATDVNRWYGVGKAGGRGGGWLCGARLHGCCRGLALRRGAGEGAQAGRCIAVVDGGSAPAVLGAYEKVLTCNSSRGIGVIQLTTLICSTFGVSVLRSAVTSKGTGDQRKDGKGSETHYEYY